MDITSGMFTVFTGRVSVVTRSIGDFELDCTVREEHSSSLRLTKNPVESGADIADHAILEPKSLTITGIVVGYEPPQPIKHLTGLDTDLMNEYPLPLELSASLGQAQSMLGSYLSVGAAVQEKATKVLAPWYPDSVNTSTDASPTLDRVGRAYEGLLALQKKGEPITVQTGIRLYTNMIITNISRGYAPISSKSPKFALSLVISRATGDILYDSINTRWYYIEKLKFRNPAV
ncbi:hypothetical protein L7834_007655 [Providencia rettgeri]|uniref:phage baseplate protein n=1 Tax=Providencia rettgeri TaxID=587 RepID=UPI001EE7417E|nr:hypothetical protein [Providencia rettgeri]MCG5369555.1 hypothetical protein [Providencia rettgeri]